MLIIDESKPAKLLAAAACAVAASLSFSGCGTARRLTDKTALFVGDTFGTEHIQMVFHKPVGIVEQAVQELFSVKGCTITRAKGGFVVKEPGMGTRYCFIQVVQWKRSGALLDAFYLTSRSEDQPDQKNLPIPFHIASRLKLLPEKLESAHKS